MRFFRSVTARLVFFYCLLLALLGGAFMLYTILSFRHYARDTMASPIPVRIQVIWDIAQGSLNDPARPTDLMNCFATEAQDRFLRIRRGADILYRSGDPVGPLLFRGKIPLQAPGPPHLLGNLLLSTRVFLPRMAVRSSSIPANPMPWWKVWSVSWQPWSLSVCRYFCCSPALPVSS